MHEEKKPSLLHKKWPVRLLTLLMLHVSHCFSGFFLYNFSLLQCSGPDNMKFNITNFRTFSRFNSFANDAQWQDSRQTLAFFIEFMSNIFFFFFFTNIANKSLFREKSLSSITLSTSGLSDGPYSQLWTWRRMSRQENWSSHQISVLEKKYFFSVRPKKLIAAAFQPVFQPWGTFKMCTARRRHPFDLSEAVKFLFIPQRSHKWIQACALNTSTFYATVEMQRCSTAASFLFTRTRMLHISQ